MTSDTIADMLTRIRNASLARHTFTTIRFNKLSFFQNIISIISISLNSIKKYGFK